MINGYMFDGLKLKNSRSTKAGREKSVAESTLLLYRMHPHYPDLEDELELKRHLKALL
jgi:hypothetical protein